jgi:predicted permease
MILGEWGRRIWYVLNRKRFERELADEMAAHREMLGEPQRFGNALRIREEARDAWVARWLDEAWQDLRHAARTLVRAPAFAITAVLILSFGIGLNLAFFQLFNVMALRPPDVTSPETLVQFHRFGKNFRSNGVPYPATQFIREHNTVLSATLMSASNRIAWDGDTARVDALAVSANWFSELGYGAALGRVFVEAIDERIDAPSAVVISHEFWRMRLQGAADVVGRAVRINNEPATIIGVAPMTFADLEKDDPRVWLLLSQIDRFSPGTEFKHAWQSHNTQLYGRLRPGVSPAAAREALRSTIAELARMQPAHFSADETLEPYLATDGFRGPRDRKELLQIAGLVGTLTLVVLMVACANIGNLVLSHAIGRLRELGVRAALGASRGRILRQQLVESLLLAGLGAIGGLVLANWAIRAFAAETSLPTYLDLAPDLRTYAAAAAIALLSTVVFGVIPAWMVSRRDLIAVMKEGGYSTSRSLARARFRLMLIGAQVTGCCVLLIVAALMVRGLQRLLVADLGFDFEQVAVVDASPRAHGIRGPAAQVYWDDVKHALAGRGDVELLALASQAPLGESVSRSFYGSPLSVIDVRVEPAFFSVMRIPLVMGRNFRPDDDPLSTVIISRRLAMDMYGSLGVVGNAFPKPDGRMIIVGISEDAPLIDAGATMVAEQYRLMGRDHYEDALLLVRSRANPANLLGPMRQAARAANVRVLPSAWLIRTSYEERVRTSSLASTIAGTTGALALTLACFGIFGVMSYSVSMRTREIGIRRALGATGSSVIGLVLRQLVLPVGVGIALGTAAGLGAGEALAYEPFYLPASDVWTPILIVMFFALTAGAAAVVPASRALGIEPLRALRHE